MPVPDLTVVKDYLSNLADYSDLEYPDAKITAALAAEKAAQARACTVPADDATDWQGADADLAEALCRRVARNLAVRAIPLGYQATAGDWGTAAFKIGADAEVRRLEAPYRRRVVG